MSNGFHSNIDIEKDINNIKIGLKEVNSSYKEVYEAIESNGVYNSRNLDEQLTDQLEEMRVERERLEDLKQKEELKEEKNQVKETKSYEVEYER